MPESGQEAPSHAHSGNLNIHAMPDKKHPFIASFRKASHGIAIAACITLITGCGGMTDREKQMVGKYYIPAVSDTRPMIELNNENRAVVSAIRPGELSFFVTGTWKVRNDSLIIENDASSITIEEGDPALVGTVASRVAYPILGYDETVLRINRGGIVYDYHRRTE